MLQVRGRVRVRVRVRGRVRGRGRVRARVRGRVRDQPRLLHAAGARLGGGLQAQAWRRGDGTHPPV